MLLGQFEHESGTQRCTNFTLETQMLWHRARFPQATGQRVSHRITVQRHHAFGRFQHRLDIR